MKQKFVVRLLDDDWNLLAWATVHAEPKPQRPRAGSCPFFAPGNTLFPVERSGLATIVAVHWCDLDVARQNRLVEPVQVEPGQVMSFAWMEPVWLVHGDRDVPLPAVTERGQVVVGVPNGTIGLVTGP